MYKISRNVTLVAIVFIADPTISSEITGNQLEKFEQVCNARLLPEEKFSLWLYTGSTTSPEETECMNRMILKETRILENKNYFELQTSDKDFRSSASISQPSSSSISSIVESTEQMDEKTAENRAQNKMPISTLRLPGYRSIK